MRSLKLKNFCLTLNIMMNFHSVSKAKVTKLYSLQFSHRSAKWKLNIKKDTLFWFKVYDSLLCAVLHKRRVKELRNFMQSEKYLTFMAFQWWWRSRSSSSEAKNKVSDVICRFNFNFKTWARLILEDISRASGLCVEFNDASTPVAINYEI